MSTTTYAQIRANAHRVGGETQTEATAKMTGLGRKGSRFLSSILESLEREASACHTDTDYVEVRTQVVRVRKALGLAVSA